MRRILLLLVVCGWAVLNVCAQMRSRIEVSVSDELFCMHFDRRGLLWIGTSSGLRSYDGYEVKNQYVTAARRYPQLGSDVRCIVTDDDGRLWAGTNDGLVRIVMSTGEARLYRFPKQSQQIIYELFVASDGTLYVGTDDGFSVYDGAADGFVHFNVDNVDAVYPDGRVDRYTGWGVKDFVETPDGDILIGTWEQGLWRYSPATGVIRGYEKLNWMNSAFTLCIDGKERLWIGTQAYGVQRMDSIGDYHLSTLQWAGKSAHGKVVYDLELLPGNDVYVCAGDTISAQWGPDGALWLLVRNGSMVRIEEGEQHFHTHYAEGSIRSLFSADGRHFVLGDGMKGVAWHDVAEGTTLHNGHIPGYTALPQDNYLGRVTSIVQRHNGELWMAARDNGVVVAHPHGSSRVLYPHSKQLPYVKDNVMALYESPCTHTLWMGQRQGVSYLTSSGEGRHLDFKDGELDMTGYFIVNHITGDVKGNVWIASASNGIVHVKEKTMEVAHYPEPCRNVTACFVDSRGAVWAIGGDGLLLYNEEKNRFEWAMIPGLVNKKRILAINEDCHGALWLATEQALVRIDTTGRAFSFTQADGIACTSFLPNATCRYGDKLYFGTAEGFVAFAPIAEYPDSSYPAPRLLVTDVLVDGTSLLTADSALTHRTVGGYAMGAQRIVLPPNTKRLAVELALLTYNNASEVVYSYLLDGHSTEWQYTDGTVHAATFDHIPAGRYTLHLRADDSKGNRYAMPYALEVVVMRPWYATWWAVLMYVVLSVALVRFIWCYLQMQREVKASRRFSTIQQSIRIQREGAVAGRSLSDAAKDADVPPLDAEQQRNAEFMARATQLVRDNLDDADYNRDSMAADLGMSVSSLYTRLRECTGLSIQTFIQNIRLNAARDMLREDPHVRISELAYRVGFNTPKYFSQCFKREFGMLPGEFVKQA